jgi:beta-lactamase class A
MCGWQKIVMDSIAGVLNEFATVALRQDELAVTFVDLRADAELALASFRGGVPMYPASVIKLFYLAAAHQQLEEQSIADTPELREALHEMIFHSGNDATSYILDLLTGTTSGPELPSSELANWLEKREVVNRHFHAVGYPEINASRKTWNEQAYGRDRQAVQAPAGSRNVLTTDATARLLAAIATGRCVSADRSAKMLAVMKRDLSDRTRFDHQAFDFIGAGLPGTAKLWSKAGYMSQARHDAAVVELASGTRFVLVIFTTRPEEKGIIPALTSRILEGIHG